MIHWNYFISLEEDLHVLSKYIEFNEDNFSTYSTQITKLFLSACSEIDVILKLLCQRHGSDSKNIYEYRKTLKAQSPDFSNFVVQLPRYNIKIAPWQSWLNDETPTWWTDYNAVKHSRHNSYKQSNLHNCLESMAGLFTCLMFFYQEEVSSIGLLPMPLLFRVPSVSGCNMSDEGFRYFLLSFKNVANKSL